MSAARLRHPVTGAEIGADYLNALLHEVMPGAEIAAAEVLEAKTYGQEMVSTAARALLHVRYTPNSPAGLPARLVLKFARTITAILAPFYSNEVAFYRQLRPRLDIEAPRAFGGAFDAETGHFGLLLEDVTARGAAFPNVTQPSTRANAEAVLDVLAALHARFWQSPRFAGDLAWVETHLEGGVANVIYEASPPFIQHEIDHENFKREMVQRLRSSGPELLAGTRALQTHQQSLPHTLLHGDAHLGNTYRLPDGKAGLVDWQLMVRGAYIHDVAYLIATTLSIADRRAHERELLAYYLDRLGALGGFAPPRFEEAWLEYRRMMMWCVYIGWLTTPVVNYGWEINLLNHLRLTTAYEDHETAKLVAALL